MSNTVQRKSVLVQFLVIVSSLLLIACQSQQTSSESSASASSSSSGSVAGSSSSSAGGVSGSSSTGSGNSAGMPSSAAGLPDEGQVSSPGGFENTDSQSGDSEAVMTDEEYADVLDGQLDDSLTVFDGMILDQRNTIEGIEDAYAGDEFPGEDSQGGDSGEPLFEEGDLASDQEGVVPGMPGDGGEESGSAGGMEDGSSAGAVAGTTTSGEGMGGEQSRPETRVPADIPDGHDDDIVARQIREAAMKENDPVLREKLWDEYRKYKNQTK